MKPNVEVTGAARLYRAASGGPQCYAYGLAVPFVGTDGKQAFLQLFMLLRSVEPKLDLPAKARLPVNERIDAAVCFLTTFETISWGNISVARVVAARKVDALAYVFDRAFNNESVDATRFELLRDAEFAERPNSIGVKR